jgi:predicted nucleic acid-binding protein
LLGHQALEPGVLLLQGFQPLEVGLFQAVVFLFPAIQRLLTDAVPSTERARRLAGRVFFMERSLIAKVMQSVLENTGLRIDHKATVVLAFDLYASSRLDFTDCLAIAHARRTEGSIYSYNRGLDHVPETRRLEP